ncbi:class I SAM-dependent methyltransferase [uncultured Aquitalea sp.]|uniref:class I SAM-dependent methyltransferase n=1 Tax=uncultured Aquitalea sp. TaxID=540272 RepID=UPI0025EB5786|nr:class I SAM-dependent methyltransferase [uncultured Aquitalea sp.]
MRRELATRFNRWRYNLYAPLYDKLAQGFAARRRRAIALLNPQPEDQVLIVGAGTGLDLDFLVRCHRLTAVDVSEGMLRRLAERAHALGLPVDARVMDAQRLELPDNSMDKVVLHLILAVIPDPVACLREVERVLKPGGKAVVFDKFLPDRGRASLLRASANLVTRVLATDINRRLGDIQSATALLRDHEEEAGFGGFFRIALLRKPPASPI